MQLKVLDHGYVEFIEAWGTGKDGVEEISMMNQEVEKPADFEAGIIEAARQSTQGNFRGWNQDAKLLKHLHDHKHATPFEFAGMVIEVQAPIFVFREWHRHRTQSYNEMSARYAPLPDLYYMPQWEMIEERAAGGNANRQATGTTPYVHEKAAAWHAELESFYDEAERIYQMGLAAGVPKELARIVMPVGHYTRMRASANLRNWLAFLTLRMDPLAQWEIRQYANALGECVAKTFPQTWKLFSS